jgi:hypothetical protein
MVSVDGVGIVGGERGCTAWEWLSVQVVMRANGATLFFEAQTRPPGLCMAQDI